MNKTPCIKSILISHSIIAIKKPDDQLCPCLVYNSNLKILCGIISEHFNVNDKTVSTFKANRITLMDFTEYENDMCYTEFKQIDRYICKVHPIGQMFPQLFKAKRSQIRKIHKYLTRVLITDIANVVVNSILLLEQNDINNYKTV